MNWTALLPGGPGLPPGLTLGDCLHRGLTPWACLHRADRIDDGEPCPDHRQDSETEAAS